MNCQLQSKKMREYLFEGSDYPFKGDNYRFLLINFDDSEYVDTVFDFLKDLFPDAFSMKEGDDYFLFYFHEPEISLKDLFASIGDDFSVSLKVYVSGRINTKHPEHFRILYQAYKEFLESAPYQYMTNAELIIEIIKNDFKRLKNIKPAVLNRISEDTQMEKLILSMFENDLNVKRTAESIFMHRNTVIYKLEYIKQETGLNLQKFTDAACIYWLLKAK
ncbi:MAG TPA: helix-turn-helix domain-containing protein [Bacilli bacterium]